MLKLLTKQFLPIVGISLFIGFCISGCGKKEEPIAAYPPNIEIICSLAPSQSKIVAQASSTLGGASATALALAQATGLSVVTHSSGALILTGPSGYIAGTLGSAISAPVIVGAGIVVAGSALTVELVCAPTNHPNDVAKIKVAADEFLQRSKISFDNITATTSQQSKKLSASIQRMAGDAYEYAFRK